MGGQLKIGSYGQCNQFYFLNIYYFNPYDFRGGGGGGGGGVGDIQGGQSPVILVKYTELYDSFLTCIHDVLHSEGQQQYGQDECRPTCPHERERPNMAGVDRVVSLLRLCAGIIGPQVLDPGLPQVNKPQLHAGHRAGYKKKTHSVE